MGSLAPPPSLMRTGSGFRLRVTADDDDEPRPSSWSSTTRLGSLCTGEKRKFLSTENGGRSQLPRFHTLVFGSATLLGHSLALPFPFLAMSESERLSVFTSNFCATSIVFPFVSHVLVFHVSRLDTLLEGRSSSSTESGSL